MIARHTPTTLQPSRWIRARKIGAALAAIGFFGTIAAAPISVSSAFAIAPGGLDVAEKSLQQFSSEPGTDPTIYLGVSEAEDLASGGSPVDALFTLEDFMFKGAINWGGHKFTYYSQQVLPGEGLAVPGRHVNAAGYVSDADGYIVLAGSAAKGTVFETPFGYQGKIYDRGTVGNHLDVYIR